MMPSGQPRAGLRGFSPTIDRLIDNRIYAPHTVDAVLQDTAIVVTEPVFERLSAPPDEARYRFDELPDRRLLLAAIVSHLDLRGPWHERLGRVARFTAAIERLFPSPEHAAAAGYYATPDGFRWGGTEEQVIAKGSDWCHEVARLLRPRPDRAHAGAHRLHARPRGWARDRGVLRRRRMGARGPTRRACVHACRRRTGERRRTGTRLAIAAA